MHTHAQFALAHPVFNPQTQIVEPGCHALAAVAEAAVVEHQRRGQQREARDGE